MQDEREQEDETLFKKYFKEKEIEFMFPSGIHGPPDSSRQHPK